MPNLTISLPNELHRFVKDHREIKWSEIVRRSIEEYSKRILAFERTVGKKTRRELDVEVEELLKKARKSIKID